MDVAATVIAALTGGGAAAAASLMSKAATDAYERLKQLVRGRLQAGGAESDTADELVTSSATDPAAATLLHTELTRVGVDEATLQAALQLQEALGSRSAAYIVDASQAKGVVVGANAIQHNTFN